MYIILIIFSGTEGRSIITYDQFKTDLLKRLKPMFPSSIVEIIDVTKNNDTTYEAVTIHTNNQKISPCIRLQSYYDDFIHSKKYASIMDVVISMLDTLQYHMPSRITSHTHLDDITNFSAVRNRIIFRLVNRSMNSALLRKLASTDFMDEFVLTYSVVVDQNDKELASIRITTSLIKLWGISLEELYSIALENTMRLFPISSFRMEEMFSHLLGEPLPTPEDNRTMMYVLSNQIGINGATVLVYPNVLKEFVSKYNLPHKHLHILPSSIHEIILVPSDNLSITDKLLQMVHEVNETQVAQDELLSDNILIYDCINSSLHLCRDGECHDQC